MLEMFKERSVWYQLGISVVLNWVVGPLLMTALAWATLPDLPHYRAGENASLDYPKQILLDIKWQQGSRRKVVAARARNCASSSSFRGLVCSKIYGCGSLHTSLAASSAVGVCSGPAHN